MLLACHITDTFYIYVVYQPVMQSILCGCPNNKVSCELSETGALDDIGHDF